MQFYYIKPENRFTELTKSANMQMKANFFLNAEQPPVESCLQCLQCLLRNVYDFIKNFNPSDNHSKWSYAKKSCIFVWLMKKQLQFWTDYLKPNGYKYIFLQIIKQECVPSIFLNNFIAKFFGQRRCINEIKFKILFQKIFLQLKTVTYRCS